MKVDFHCHTTASDGTLTPEALLDLALEHEVRTLAITDHDTTAGYQQVLELVGNFNIDLISGVEISCEWNGHTIHIVGLDFDVQNPNLQTGLASIREARVIRAQDMLEKLTSKPNAHLQKLPEKITHLVGDGVIGRGHFAQAMVELGLVKDNAQAFERYLKRGRIGYVKAQWPALAEVVQWITEAGGIAVIAHPKIYKFTSSKLNRLIEDFITAGGKAIEVVNAPRPSADMIGMAERARRFGLYASIGSDFHSPKHHWRGLGWLAPLPEGCIPVWEQFSR
ncbi:PHP domain-containing protein [Thiomicrorhabdus sp. 6S3-12]|uniref:PHP domain-containing protein n=1 Tax=Thiomicrorhabdus sp. 6S3-12 TaxID=2819681 RepID=UPI001AAD400A|nr:PHP domain-containing protein [Thiomicrorhabdus sp. 6S3-12]MBO1925163.1 PHP domain-containing protein [Thiomicrorhabdus sp. 6S3-12]